jgi:hypothetical protein
MPRENAFARFMVRLGDSGLLVRVLIAFLALVNAAGLFGLFVPPALRSGDLSAIRIAILYPTLIIVAAGGLIVFQEIRARRTNARLASHFDPVAADWGLKGARQTRWGRRYQGQFRGRDLHVHVVTSEPDDPKGRPYLGFYVGAAVPTRVSIIGRAHQVKDQDAGPLETIYFGDETLQPYAFITLDSEWTRATFRDEGIREPLIRLLKKEEKKSATVIYLQPDALGWESLRLAGTRRRKEDDLIPADLTPKRLNEILNDLYLLVERLEAAPSPALTDTTTPVEMALRKNPNVTQPAMAAAGLLIVDLALWIIVTVLLLRG